jgi:hypothetical protein
VNARRKRRTRATVIRLSRWAGFTQALRITRRRLRQRRIERPRDRRRPRSAAGVALIGLDVSRAPVRLQTRSWAPVVVAALAGGLFLATLRMDVLRMRFSVAERFAQQMQLEQRKRQLTVRMRELRDPAELSQRAQQLGFRRAERLIDLRNVRDTDLPSDGSPVDSILPAIELAAAAPGATARLPRLPGKER